MPFPILAHQAPVLPLKLLWPRWFSAVALCAGSMAPDVDLAVRIDHAGVGHTALGQFIFCLPITLAVTIVVARVIAPTFGARAMDPLGSPGAFVVVLGSALVGSFSHIGLDLLTHKALALQLGVSLVGGLLGAWLLVHLLRRAQLVRPRSRGGWLLAVLPVACAVLAVVASRQVIRHASYYFVLAPFYVVGYVAFRAFLAAFVGLTVASALVRGTAVAR